MNRADMIFLTGLAQASIGYVRDDWVLIVCGIIGSAIGLLWAKS